MDHATGSFWYSIQMIRIIVFIILTAVVVFGQTRKEFEVASIRAAGDQAPNQVTAGLHIDGSQVRISYLSLKDYISMAYRTRLNQIAGPDFLGTQRFDVAGKLPEGASQSDVLEMLQNLLTDRFQLKFHREKRELPVYVLGVAPGGIKIPEAAPADSFGQRDTPVTVSAGGNAAGVAIDLGQGSTFALGATAVEVKKLSMETFADMLTRFLDRPVVDQTNLKAAYDMKLELTPEDRIVMLIRSAVAAGVVLPPQALALLDGGSIGSLTDALKKVGLTLESKRAPLEVIVVDQIQKTPTEN